VEALYRLGANEVIPEEFETSVEIFTRVLTKYLVPKEEIARLLVEVREAGYQMFRNMSSAAARVSVADLHLHLQEVEIAPIFVSTDSPLAGKSLAELDLRRKTGLTLLAIRRDSQLITDLDAETKICPNDELFVIGRPDKVALASVHLV
jgi:CPA2 family monovalent cation:H+ antiporter-2